MSMKMGAMASDADKHEYDVTSMVFLGGLLYTGSDDGKIKVWNRELRKVGEVTAHPCSVYSLATDGVKTLFSCSNDGTVKAWKATGTTLDDAGILFTSEREFWKLCWEGGIGYAADDLGNVWRWGAASGHVETLEQIKDMGARGRLLLTVRDLDVNVLEQAADSKAGRVITCATLPGRAPLTLAGDIMAYSSRDGHTVNIAHATKEQRFQLITEIKDASEKLMNALCLVDKPGAAGEFHLFLGGWDCLVKRYGLTMAGYDSGAGYCATPTPGYVNCLCVGDDVNTIFAAGANGAIWRIDCS